MKRGVARSVAAALATIEERSELLSPSPCCRTYSFAGYKRVQDVHGIGAGINHLGPVIETVRLGWASQQDPVERIDVFRGSHRAINCGLGATVTTNKLLITQTK